MSKVAILCEGSTDIQFLKQFIEYLGLKKNDVIPYIMDGKNNFFNLSCKKYCQRYRDLQEEIESGQIEKVLFVLDADHIKDDKEFGGFDNTKKRLEKLIDDLGLKGVSDFYIMCDPDNKTGSLESLVLSTIDDPKEKQCITNLLNCPKITPEDHKSLVAKIFYLFYPTNPYNFDHKNFDELKEKLKTLFINSEEQIC